MKPHNTPSIPVPPLPVWEVVPTPDAALPANALPVLEPVEPGAALPMLEPVEPAQRPAPLPTAREPVRRPAPVPEPARRPPVIPVLTVVPDRAPPRPAPLPAPLRALEEPFTPPPGQFATLNQFVDTTTEICLGLVCLPLGLAVLASLPVLNFIALGYLLEAGARIARSGKLRSGFFGIRRAGRVGGMFLGIFLTLLPVWLVSSMARSAELIDPTSAETRQWQLGSMIATVLTVVHITLACLWGGKLRHFLLPMLHPLFAILTLRTCNPITRARDAVWTFVTEAEPWYFFWLGLRGGLGALIWLAGPVTLLALGWKIPLFGFLGFLCLLPVLIVLPFLQMNFARTNDVKKMFDVRSVLRMYVRLPWAFTFALFITLLFALPLYLLKIEAVPRDALFLPSILFIAFIWPARLLTGWVVGKAERRDTPRHWFFSVTAAIPIPFFVLIYAFFVWLSQYLSWYGVGSLYEQHPFLLPVPFTGL